MSTLQANFDRQLAEIHASNVAAGWWSDLRTGESILRTRNRGELMMLVVSELSEASYGLAKGLPDDKLPHLWMYDVELADTAIRLFDIIGAETAVHGPLEAVCVATEVAGRRAYLQGRTPDARLMMVVNEVSAAMEHHRKSRIAEYRTALNRALYMLLALAAIERIDLFKVIDEKRDFNSVRADHKVENRRAVGGKAY